jgi:glutamate dehydrogenase (NAD(P)+)
MYTRGAGEADLVASGLEDTMCDAFNQIRETQVGLDPMPDLRIAAMVCAIRKIALCYEELGIFP